MSSSSAVGRGMFDSPGMRNPGKFAVSILLGVMILGASVVPSMGATYSADPAPGNFKDVGVGYRFRVSSISAGVATFEVLPKTGTFGSSGRAVIKKDSINGTIVGTGIPYAAGASTAGSIAVDISAAGLTSGSMHFFAVREGDTNVYDGPITIITSGFNGAPTVAVSSAVIQSDGDLLVNWTANDDLTSSIGTDLYISVNGDINTFSFLSRQTPPNSVRGVPQAFTFPAAFLGTLGMNQGGTFRVRVNVFDGSVPQLDGVAYSPTFTYALSSSNDAPTVEVASAAMQPNGDLLVNWTANDDLTSAIGTDVYISINENLNTFSFQSRQTPPSSVSGVPQAFTFPAAFLGTLGMNPGGTFRVRVNVFDGGNPQLDGMGFSPTFIYTLPFVVRPDVAVGTSLAGLVGRGVFSPNGQAITLFSKQAQPVVSFATLENRGTRDDSLIVAASPRNSLFDVTYTIAGVNVTGALTAGVYVTPVIDRTDSAVLIRAEVKPSQSKLKKKNGRGGGFTVLKRSFITSIRATATSDPSLSDSAAILVRTR